MGMIWYRRQSCLLYEGSGGSGYGCDIDGTGIVRKCISPEHGVADVCPEKTMQNIGLIAYPGMTETERVILEIMQNKKGGAKGHEETD